MTKEEAEQVILEVEQFRKKVITGQTPFSEYGRMKGISEGQALSRWNEAQRVVHCICPRCGGTGRVS
jgi:hypothetical protein